MCFALNLFNSAIRANKLWAKISLEIKKTNKKRPALEPLSLNL